MIQEGSSALSLRFDPPLCAPSLKQLVFTREEAVHRGVAIDALDSLFGDHQLVPVTVRTEARFASLPLGTSNEDI
jgi:hypothetical protein